MLKNFLSVSLRGLRREGRLTIINVFGLCTALASSLVILLYVHQQLSFDRFSQAESIYRLEIRQISDQSPKWAISPKSWTADYAARLSEVEDFMFVGTYLPQTEVAIGDSKFYEDDIFYSNSSIIDFLDIELIGSQSDDLLSGPKKVLLSQSQAARYFGVNDPVGQFLKIGGEEGYLVTGVFQRSKPSHISPDIIVSEEVTPGEQGWLYNYLKLSPGTNPGELEAKINNMATELQEVFFTDSEYSLINLQDVYFHSKSKYQLSESGNLNSVYIFAGIALMILVVAGLNFVNLTAASMLRRTGEAGVRKVLGSAPWELFLRFLTEASLLSMSSLFLAMVLAYALIPQVNQLWGLNIDFGSLPLFWVLITVLALMLLTSLAAVLPVFRIRRQALSQSFNQGKSLKGKSVLMTFQFVVSMLLIIGTLLIRDQLSFLQSRDLGYGEDRVLFINAIDPSMKDRNSENRKRFEGHPSVLHTATIMGAPGDPAMMGNQNAWAEGMAADENIFLPLYAGDKYLVETLGLEILEGKGFSQGVAVGDSSTAVLINETAVKRFGWEEPLGKRMKISGNNHTVIGVVKDFHFLSLQNNIGPLAIAYQENSYMIAVRMRADGVAQAMAHIQEQWEKIQPEKPMESFFLEENFNKQYLHEQRLDHILKVLTVLSLIISAVGTLGIMMLYIQQKTREIGVRKVLGASVGQVLLLLNRQVFQVIVLANLIAWPVAWYFSGQWLNTFAYAVKPNLVFYLLAGLITLVVSLTVLGLQSVRAARANPVDVLRNE